MNLNYEMMMNDVYLLLLLTRECNDKRVIILDS